MKQIDYLKLVNTGRRSSYFEKHSSDVQQLTGLIGYGAIAALGAIFIIAVIASYLGASVTGYMVGIAMAPLLVLAVYLGACTFIVSGAHTTSRVLMAIPTTITPIALLILAYLGKLNPWYFYLPLFVYSLLVSRLAIRQLIRGRSTDDRQSANSREAA